MFSNLSDLFKLTEVECANMSGQNFYLTMVLLKVSLVYKQNYCKKLYQPRIDLSQVLINNVSINHLKGFLYG